MELTLLGSALWDAADLGAQYPAVHRHRNKRAVQEIAGATFSGQVMLTRWQALRTLPSEIGPWVKVVAEPGYFRYDNDPKDGKVHWHLNFADRHLFGFWDRDLFAQDESQVAEHPVLASVVPAMVDAGIDPYTETDAWPTPVLLTGVERRCAVDTTPGPGKPRGLYGNRFAAAPEAVVRAATRKIDPPTISNIIAMAAPTPGAGPYTRDEIKRVLVTATTGFRAAVTESEPSPVVVHTGFWGCGAFGGNRVLMTMLQIVAARSAGVTELHVHYGDESGEGPVEEAVRQAKRLGHTMLGEAVVDLLFSRKFQWGESDGN